MGGGVTQVRVRTVPCWRGLGWVRQVTVQAWWGLGVCCLSSRLDGASAGRGGGLSWHFRLIQYRQGLLSWTTNTYLNCRVVLLVTSTSRIFMDLRFVMVSGINRLLLTLPRVCRFKGGMSTQLRNVCGAQLRQGNRALQLATRLHTLKLSIVTRPRFARVLRIVRIRPRRISRPIEVRRDVYALTRNIFNVSLRRPRSFRAFSRRAYQRIMCVRVEGAQAGHFRQLRIRNILCLMGLTLAPNGLFVNEGNEQRVTYVARLHFYTNVSRRRVTQLSSVTVVVIIRHLSIRHDSNDGQGIAPYNVHRNFRNYQCLPLTRPKARSLRNHGIRVHHGITNLLSFSGLLNQLMIALHSRHASGQRQALLAHKERSRPIRRLRFVLYAMKQRMVSNLSLLCHLIRVTRGINQERNSMRSRPLALFLRYKLDPRPCSVVSNRFVARCGFLVFVGISCDQGPNGQGTRMMRGNEVLAVTRHVILMIRSALIISRGRRCSKTWYFFRRNSTLHVYLFTRRGNVCWDCSNGSEGGK